MDEKQKRKRSKKIFFGIFFGAIYVSLIALWIQAWNVIGFQTAEIGFKTVALILLTLFWILGHVYKICYLDSNVLSLENAYISAVTGMPVKRLVVKGQDELVSEDMSIEEFDKLCGGNRNKQVILDTDHNKKASKLFKLFKIGFLSIGVCTFLCLLVARLCQ